MKSQDRKKRIVSSSAALISIGIHVVLLLTAGSIVAFKIYKNRRPEFQIEEKKKLERQKLQMPVKTEPFMEQMSKPRIQTTTRIRANTPQMINIPEQGEYLKLAPMPTFQNAYTNFVQMDRTMEFNSKYRQVDFGISPVDFFGTKGKAEKVAVIIDASTSMLLDDRGGMAAYDMVRTNLDEVIGELKSATLFDVVLFDHEKVSLFSPALTSATPANRERAIAWFGGINTNLAATGLAEEQDNYRPKQTYDVPMAAEDMTGWLKAFQATVEMRPEVIFLLSADWGNVSTTDRNLSYFVKQSKNAEYQQARAQLFLDSQRKEDRSKYDEFLAECDQMHTVAQKMLELENEARAAADMQPKIVRDWDDILVENKATLPIPPISKDQEKMAISPGETRYTTEEVIETIFSMVVANYGHKGFPQINCVMLRPESFKSNSESDTMLLTSSSKFTAFTKMVGGRFRYLKGVEPIKNLLAQDVSDILKAETTGN